MPYTHTHSYLINHINMSAAQKNLSVIIWYSRKSISLLKLLFAFSMISNFYIFTRKNFKKFIKIYPLYYKNQPLTKNFRLISTPSRTFHISYLALRILQKRTSTSIYFLSTNQGLITHHDALVKKIGGVLIGFAFN